MARQTEATKKASLLAFPDIVENKSNQRIQNRWCIWGIFGCLEDSVNDLPFTILCRIRHRGGATIALLGFASSINGDDNSVPTSPGLLRSTRRHFSAPTRDEKRRGYKKREDESI